MKGNKKLIIMVSSTVYGIEELLDRIYTLLADYGYEVWISHKGTLPVRSDRTAFENCLAAVEQCDLFLGIITTSYGSVLMIRQALQDAMGLKDAEHFDPSTLHLDKLMKDPCLLQAICRTNRFAK